MFSCCRRVNAEGERNLICSTIYALNLFSYSPSLGHFFFNLERSFWVEKHFLRGLCFTLYQLSYRQIFPLIVVLDVPLLPAPAAGGSV